MGKRKVVLDTNVLISALGWGGPPEDCLELVLRDEVTNFYSLDIHDELSRVMDYPKFEFSEEEKETFLEIILSRSVLVEPSQDVEAVKEDPSDNIFLECALEAEAEFVVSGDPHLLKIGKFKDTVILTPKTFLKRFEK